MPQLRIALVLLLVLTPAPILAPVAAACSTPTAIGPAGTAVWCQGPLVDGVQGTYHELADGWSDDFGYPGTPAQLAKDQSQDTGYLTWEGRGSIPVQTQQFRSAGLWFADVAGAGNGGSLMRPDRSFTTEAGHLVVDAESATYSRGDVEWSEIVVTTAVAPTTEQGLYARDQFGGADTFACLFKHDPNYHSVVACTLIGTGPYGPGTEQNYICKSDNNGNLCGSGSSVFDPPAVTVCPQQPLDVTACLNRFRLDLTPTGWTVTVNGATWLTDAFTLPAAFAGPLFVYFGSWTYEAPGVVRHAWRHLDVNPGSGPLPSPSPSPTPSPIAIQGVPCTVQLPSGPASGHCSGTFLPN